MKYPFWEGENHTTPLGKGNQEKNCMLNFISLWYSVMFWHENQLFSSVRLLFVHTFADGLQQCISFILQTRRHYTIYRCRRFHEFKSFAREMAELEQLIVFCCLLALSTIFDQFWSQLKKCIDKGRLYKSNTPVAAFFSTYHFSLFEGFSGNLLKWKKKEQISSEVNLKVFKD